MTPYTAAAGSLKIRTGSVTGRQAPGRSGQQAVGPGTRTCGRSAPPANLSANSHTCRRRSVRAAANAQDLAKINLPMDSQTLYTGQACKTTMCGERACMPCVKSWPPVRGGYSYTGRYRPPGPCGSSVPRLTQRGHAARRWQEARRLASGAGKVVGSGEGARADSN